MGKIVAIGATAEVQLPADVLVVDAPGKFVVPGFINGHVHMFSNQDAVNAQALMLIHGITSVRQMNGAPDLLEARKQGRLFRTNFAPKLLGMPGDVLMTTNAFTEEEGRAQVRKQKAEGADFIKIALVPPAVFFAVGDEAKKQNLPFVGHLPPGVDPYEAVRAGFHAIEHLGPMDGTLISCSTDEANIKAQIAAHPMRKPPPLPSFLTAGFMRKLLASPILAQAKMDDHVMPRLQHVEETYDEGRCRKLAQYFAAQGTWHVPTLIRIKTYEFADDPALMHAPELRYVSETDLKLWREIAADFTKSVTPTQKEALHMFWLTQLKFLKLLDEANVPMMVGTDEVGGNWMVAGVDLHQEFDLLAEAGLTPLKILQMATLNGAKFFGRESTLGSVTVGKEADLVLLDDNPVQSVQNLSRINAVVRSGVYYSRQKLDERLRGLVSARDRPGD